MLNDRIENLRRALPALPAGNQPFANKLLKSFDDWGNLSEKQWYWVDKLAEPKPAPVEIGDLSGVLALFAKAQEKLKRPAIVLHVPGVCDIRISVAGERSSAPGSLNVAENARFGEGRWFGRISPAGAFKPSGRCEIPAALLTALRAFAERPAEVAAEHGKTIGACCFCNKTLTDESSKANGYGKTCASKWGMPYVTTTKKREPSKQKAKVRQAPPSPVAVKQSEPGLPETMTYDLQPYGTVTLGELKRGEYNGSPCLEGTVIGGTTTSYLCGFTSTKPADGYRTIYGIRQDEIDKGHAIRIAM